MYDQFTDRMRRAISYSREAADRLNQDHIGAEHLLLGLLKEGKGVAAEVIIKLGVTLESAQAAVEKLAEKGREGKAGENLPFNHEARLALDFALEEARKLEHRYIGTEHLLLGLLRVNETAAAKALGALGLDEEKVRAAVIAFLSKNG
jgi:ATP-dependent Clp protease ATP-binding subunit ClpC